MPRQRPYLPVQRDPRKTALGPSVRRRAYATASLVVPSAMKKPKPHRRLPKARRPPVIHPTGLSKELLEHRTRKPRPAGAVTSGEMMADLLAFIAERYAGRHLDVETAQLALSNVAHQMIVTHLRAVANETRRD